MRKLSCLLATALLAMPLAHAQQHADTTATAGAATAGASTEADIDGDAPTPANADADAAANDAPHSGFGQVMSVLTSLLEDAARREATGHGEGLVLDNPAIEISGTPVAGETSLLRANAGRHAVPTETAPAAIGRQLAGGDPG